MEYILAPSILAADFNKLGEEMKETQSGGAKYLHFDVMDGKFVPSISFGMPVLASIRNTTKQIKDVHLMIEEPIRYVEEFANSGADIITVHLEACSDIKATIKKIRDVGSKVGITIKPKTPAEDVEELLDIVDMVLVMSVEPGFGGQKFIPESLDKIKKIREMSNNKNLDMDIQVDGGIYLSNVKDVLEAGANIIVAGSAVFKENPREQSMRFMEMLKSYE
ncbi:MAG: ribulose-phosphate 3-epimerase [Suipraeoptans sp.]